MKHINLSNYKGSITDWTILNYVKGGLADNLADIVNIKVNDSCYNYLAKSQNLVNISDKTISSPGYIFNTSINSLKNNTVYTCSFNWTGGGSLQFRALKNNINVGSDTINDVPSGRNSITITTTDVPDTIYLYANNPNGGTASDIMINEGSTALPYEPYGKLVIHQNAGIVDLGTLTWIYRNGMFACYDIQTEIKKPTSDSNIANISCSKYETQSRDYVQSHSGYCGANMSGTIVVNDSSFEGDAEAFKAAMSGVMLKYELANPQIIILKSVDLGTLNYQLEVRTGRNIFKTTISDIMPQASKTVAINASCPLYRPVSNAAAWVDKDMAYAGDVGSTQVSFVNNDYNNVADFKAAMNGVILLYEPASTSSTVTTLSMSNELNETEFNDNVEELDNFEESTIKEES